MFTMYNVQGAKYNMTFMNNYQHIPGNQGNLLCRFLGDHLLPVIKKETILQSHTHIHKSHGRAYDGWHTSVPLPFSHSLSPSLTRSPIWPLSPGAPLIPLGPLGPWETKGMI